MVQMNLFTKETHRHRKQTNMVTKAGGDSGGEDKLGVWD